MPPPIPPIVLVRTWLQLLRADNDEEARTHSKKMLSHVFGSVDLAVEYLEQIELARETKSGLFMPIANLQVTHL